MKILILHAYNANNAGDGLLVHETINLVKNALGEDVALTIVASHPETFSGLDARIVDSSPTWTGYSREYLHLLRSLNEYDAIMGVGGGYLRAGHSIEAFKTLLVHGPQLVFASRSTAPTIYLPQSVGPSFKTLAALLSKRMENIDVFYVRDDRSLRDFRATGVTRTSDLAILGGHPIQREDLSVEIVPVLSVRAVRGKISPMVRDLAAQLGQFDGYVQSNTSGNNDVASMSSLRPRKILTRNELMGEGVPSRVVVAVRLHAALMAQRAGHFVIHLAYERKGFGAYQDLGLSRYVHNVNKFEPERVMQQVRELLDDESVRNQYSRDLDVALEASAVGYSSLVSKIRELVPGGAL